MLSFRPRASSVVLAVVLPAVALAAMSASAEGKLDVPKWLNRPNVKLLAVEFYATWCTPCMEAVPRWKALHEKYRNQGFRLVVVNTLDPGGQCKSVGWNPDDYVCDLDGRIANAFGVGGGLPAAFLWSWQGNLLLRKGHIDAAEGEVERYLAASPKVLISAFDARGRPDAALAAMVKSEVATAGKLQVVASDADRGKLEALRKASHGLGKAATAQCKLGAEVSANSLLEARLLGKGAGAKLTVTLNSAESGCLLASTYANYDPARPEASVREVIAGLTDTLRQAPEMPAGLTAPQAAAGPQGAAPAWQAATGKKAIVQFTSTPAGAVVMVDGKLLCQSTPCAKSLRSGRHAVAMHKEGFVGREAVVVLDKGSKVAWPLPKNEAWLSVVTAQPGLQVAIDGEPAGRTPVAERKLAPGRHQVEVSDRCYLPTRLAVDLQPGQRQRLVVKARQRVAGLEVDVEDAAGNAVAAMVYVDGQQVGESPDTLTVPLCGRTLEARADGKRVTQPLKLEERKTTVVKLTLGRSAVAAVKAPVVAKPSSASGSSQRTWGWVATIAGVLAAGGGGVAYALSHGEGKDLEDITAQQGTTQTSHAEAMDDKARIEGDLIVRGAVLGAGLGLTALGVVLLATAPEAAASAVTTDGRGVGLVWRF